ncbi:MAG: NTP transferase domain-containing protein [Oligoflexia bacterium]|nr:NTP transferase domain-containing protein [Oligoflexia bacterium]
MNKNKYRYGLVLVGGKSERMGADKGQLAYHYDKSQVTYTFDLLSNFCDRVFVSCREEQAQLAHIKDYPQIRDNSKYLNNNNNLNNNLKKGGPIVGILSAMDELERNDNIDFHQMIIVLACDMPNIDKNILDHLIKNHQQKKSEYLVTAFQNPDKDKEWPEPLCTIYDFSVNKHLLKMLEEGIKCPRKMLTILNEKSLINLIKLPTSSRDALVNINTTEEYQKYKKHKNERKMQVKVRYYAILREKTKVSEENISVNDLLDVENKKISLNNLYTLLDKKYNFSDLISKEKLTVAVNSQYVDFDYELKDADTVIFIPPISGG